VRTALVTGATGFIGSHLITHLLTQDELQVVGLCRGEPSAAAGVQWRKCNLLDLEATQAVVREVHPDWVFHLAGFANPSDAETYPDDCWKANLDATRNLYAALAANERRPDRILFASSAHVYGRLVGTITEETQLLPASVYGKSKAEAERYTQNEAPKLGLRVVRARLFNAVGVGQKRGYAVPDWAWQVAEIAWKKQPPPFKPGGSLAGWKDLTDVRDVVVALRLLLEHGTLGEGYNVATGQSHLSLDVVNQLISLASPDLPKVPTDPADPPAVKWEVDVSKLKVTTGWEPQYPLDRTLADVLESWKIAPPSPAGRGAGSVGIGNPDGIPLPPAPLPVGERGASKGSP
jgi:GDP-4-dehydro-6-deoxy-D-mannose reductase